ncbi:hypothetical protein [Thalassotalea sp. ND16A]|uniref:hypothetical protein n=1 Tax=Thalassotalea sp. ND16A TaxID=1535422 RepID=UPI0012699FA8|nr:hypothetical protein [Thalassotalea sp. ND16A]
MRNQVGAYAFEKEVNEECKADEFITETTESAGEWLQTLLATHTFTGSGYLVLSASHYYSVQINKPNLPDDEIPLAIKWLVKDIVPIDPDDMIVDYFDSPVIVAGTEKINVVCSHLSHLKKFTDTFKRHQVELKGIITDEFAFANLVDNVDNSTLMVCQQPFEDVFLLIVNQGEIYFSRRLRGFNDIGGYSREQLSQGICDSLSVEIQKSMDYFERLLKQSPVTRIKVLLPVTHEDFIIENLAKNTEVVISEIELPEPFAKLRNCAASIGALTEFEKVGVVND